MFFPGLCDAIERNGGEIVDIKSRQAFLLRFDCVLVHFPEHYPAEQTLPRAAFWSAAYMVFFVLCWLRGRRIVWFVHDVRSFEARNRWLANAFMQVFSKLVWGYVFLSASSEETFKRENPFYRAGVIHTERFFHSPYVVRSPAAGEVETRRAEYWGTAPACVVGFIGHVKKYKNIGALKRLKLNGDGNIKLLVAGSCDKENRPAAVDLKDHFADSRDFVYLDRQLDNDEFEQLLQTCDIAVLPYSVSYNSGVAMHALSCGVRVLASDLPIFRELRDLFGPVWVRIISGDINADIRAMAAEPIDAAQRAGLRQRLDAIGIDGSASRLLDFVNRA